MIYDQNIWMIHFSFISFFYILNNFPFVMKINSFVFCKFHIYLLNYIFSIQFSLCILFDSVCVPIPVSWFDLSGMLTFGGGVA